MVPDGQHQLCASFDMSGLHDREGGVIQHQGGCGVARAGDFPDVARYREILSAYDLSAFPKLKDKDIKNLDDTLSIDIPGLVRQFDNPYASAS